jgi:hypothetical protein
LQGGKGEILRDKGEAARNWRERPVEEWLVTFARTFSGQELAGRNREQKDRQEEAGVKDTEYVLICLKRCLLCPASLSFCSCLLSKINSIREGGAGAN